MTQRLRIPLVVTVTVVASLGSCASPPTPSTDAQAAAETTAATDVPRDTTADVCPDPLECYGDLVFIDGSVNPVYLYRRRDGGISDVACPMPPGHCPIA